MALNVAIGTSRDIYLARALLLYAAGETRSYTASDPIGYATIHDVSIGPDHRSKIEAGRPINAEEIIEIFHTLTKSADDLPLLPEHVLAHGLRGTCWYRPAAPATLWFAEKADTLYPLSGRHFYQPALVFAVTGKTMIVRAVKSAGRPTAATALFKAPYFNINPHGLVCMGNARLPDDHRLSSIRGWEAAFFESRFSHPNDALAALTNHPEGLAGYWRANLRGRRRQDTGQFLVPARETLGGLLKRLRA